MNRNTISYAQNNYLYQIYDKIMVNKSVGVGGFSLLEEIDFLIV